MPTIIILTCGVCVYVCVPPLNPVYKHSPNLFLIGLNRAKPPPLILTLAGSQMSRI